MYTSLVVSLCDAQHQNQTFNYFSNMTNRGTKGAFVLQNIWVNQSQQLSHLSDCPIFYLCWPCNAYVLANYSAAL